MVDVCMTMILVIVIVLFIIKAVEFPKVNRVLTEIKYIEESINKNDKLIVKMATQINRTEMELMELKILIENMEPNPPLRTGPGRVTSKSENEKRIMKENRRVQTDGQDE